MKTFILMSIIFVFVSCSSSPQKVVYRMDDVGSKPDWATLSKSVWKKDGKYFAVGRADADNSANVTALARVADNNAKTELSRMIQNEVGVQFQNGAEGVHGAGLVKFIGTESSLVNTQELIVEDRYFEKVAIDNGTEVPTMETHFYSLVSIPTSTVQKLFKDKEDSNVSELKQVSEEFKNQVTEQAKSTLVGGNE
jgi:hypothetical protein